MRQLFLAGDSFAIGRAADNDAILDDPHVSRHHARIDPEKRAYLRPIEDRFGDVFGEDVLVAWAALAAIIVGLFVLVYVLQKRKDVI